MSIGQSYKIIKNEKKIISLRIEPTIFRLLSKHFTICATEEYLSVMI